jgi:N-acetylmuramoyl-L-alanine amidase
LQIMSSEKNPSITFYVDHPFQYHRFTLTNPERLVIDFIHTIAGTHLNRTFSRYSLIKNIRSSVHHKYQLRVVFDFSQKFKASYFYLKPKVHEKFGYRLSIHLTPLGNISSKHIKPKAKPLHARTFKKKPLRDAVVVIDPGHGGKDPGAVGLYGIKEKNVVLAIGTDLYDLLKKQYGVDPRLTRHGDYFVTLRGRLRLARKGIADVFVAIHADGYRSRSAHGASVFALSEHGATTEAARWLAQKENYSELMGGVDLSDKSYLLRSVLIDLSQTATIRESLLLGDDVLSALGHVTHLHHGFVEQAPFVVLKSPDIPSILVETGFISNRYEERRLSSKLYQQKIANALSLGIVQYLHQHPPKGTFLAVRYRKK